ncbi:hypothetical protein [Thiohalophilus sp.]|uniref:hypothetical protein n=1 Tax=Thiohalophilus sp. TaxID=3028392 RepID=UPI002ACD90B1|nr:hypothetical protein [Thiohalophilus sp.]MDZ7661202.1 hypothetical protein [Thiohalophilus sp.]
MSDFEIDEAMFGNKAQAAHSEMSLEEQLQMHQQRVAELSKDASTLDRARARLDVAELLLALERKEEAWQEGRDIIDTFLNQEAWQDAVETYNVLFQCEQPASLSALGQGVWLAVTFPIMPQTTITMLNHIIDETPADADGAAVAAITSHYIADLRSPEDKHESLTFLTSKILADVAKRHSDVETQEQMDMWLKKLELEDPKAFLPRLSMVIDVLVQDDWWFDREAVREKLPVH